MEGGTNMGFILDIFSLAVYIPFLQVDEEDISRNAAHLKKHSRFHELLNDPNFTDISSFIIQMSAKSLADVTQINFIRSDTT